MSTTWTHLPPSSIAPSWANVWTRPACNGLLVAHVEQHRRDRKRGGRDFSVAICGGETFPVDLWLSTRCIPPCYFRTVEEAQAHADVLERAVMDFGRRIAP